MTKVNPQYKKSGAMFMVGGFGVVILAISAVTTFSFFSTYFSSIFPTGMLGPELASLLAGGAGVILFDIASVYWLHTFLNHAETSEQRGIALIMLIVTFVGAAGASIAQLGLAASGDVALDPATRQSIANASVWTVIIGVVSNFGANIAYGRFSLASKQAVMEADRRDMVQNAEDEQARLLDGLIAQNVKELITAEAGKLAQEQAKRVVAAFRAREMAKYAGVESKPEATPPQPQKQQSKVRPVFKRPRPASQVDKSSNDLKPYQVQYKQGDRDWIDGPTFKTQPEAGDYILQQKIAGNYRVVFEGKEVFSHTKKEKRFQENGTHQPSGD